MPNLELDQHFLIDTNVLQSIMGFAHVSCDDVVLEVGPGKGILTRELGLYAQKVFAIEIDEYLASELGAISANVEVLLGNALHLMDDIKFNKIVANIPYALSEPLLKKMLKRDIDCAVLLVGAHFYDVLCNPQSKWSVIVPLFFSFEKKLDVDALAFDPPPKTRSCVIVFNRAKKELSDYEHVLKEFVLQDDKKVKNALRYAFMRVYNLTKKQADEKVFALELSSRAYECNVDRLSNKDFYVFYNKLQSL